MIERLRPKDKWEKTVEKDLNRLVIDDEIRYKIDTKIKDIRPHFMREKDKKL